MFGRVDVQLIRSLKNMANVETVNYYIRNIHILYQFKTFANLHVRPISFL